MYRKPHAAHVTTHHSLLSDAWTEDVRTLEMGISEFATPRGSANECQVALFEMPGDAYLHVNVTHRHEKKGAKGWAGPGNVPEGFVHNRTFESSATDGILRQIRQMVFAPPA